MEEVGPVARVLMGHINSYGYLREDQILGRQPVKQWRTNLIKYEKYLWDIYQLQSNFSIPHNTWIRSLAIVWAERHKDWFKKKEPSQKTRDDWINTMAERSVVLCRQASQVKIKGTKWAEKNSLVCCRVFKTNLQWHHGRRHRHGCRWIPG